jgi:excisionase family DNA binding protein
VSDILRDYHSKDWESRGIDGFCLRAYDSRYHRIHGGEILPLVVEGENYYTAKEAAEYLGIARDTFYRNIRNRLPTYHYGAFRRDYFRQSDLDRYKGIRPAEKDELDQS